MRPKLERLRRLLRRYRVDRRLPPPVRALVADASRLRLAERADRLVGAARPVVGDRSGGVERQFGRYRVATAGPPPRSISELALEAAAAVEQILVDEEIDGFLVRRSGDRLEIGVPLAARGLALRALAARLESQWYVEWFDRGGSGLVTAGAAGGSRARAARLWRVFRAFEWGDRAIGPEAGVDISFWEPGASGEVELVGTRGHERFDPRSARTVEHIAGRAFRGRCAFPVANTLETLAEPVDIVFTWVDGSDPSWLADFRRTASAVGRRLDESALDPARYRNRDELRYSLRSVWAYCGWVRKIWVVTAGQIPEWFVDGSDARVTFVDHAEIMPADALPTFNSHAIEASLHHIDGLAEHFVYFNDDVFVGRPLRPEAFFTPNGLARVFQSGARVPGYEDDSTLAVDTAALRGRELLQTRFGRVVTHKPLHSPHPLRRSTLFEVDATFADFVHRTVHSQFRSPTDLSVAASFGQHYGIAVESSVFGDIRSEYVHVESARLTLHLNRIRLGDDVDTFCINETQDGAGRHDREALVRDHLDRCFPVATPWEQHD